MEIGYILNELWRLRVWVAVGLAVALLAVLSTMYRLPSLEKKTFELGAASTEVLVDAPRSPLAALGTDPNRPNADVQTLVTRAQVYARLMESEPVKARISRELGISADSLATLGPQPGVDGTGRKTSSAERGAELLTESDQLRLFASSSEEIPIVSLFAQARTAVDAIKLADAGARALAGYVQDLQDRQKISLAERIQIRQLGRANGGLVNSGVDRFAAALTFMGVFGFWCVLLLLAARTMLSWRAARRAPDAAKRTDRKIAIGNDREDANGGVASAVRARDEVNAG